MDSSWPSFTSLAGDSQVLFGEHFGWFARQLESQELALDKLAADPGSKLGRIRFTTSCTGSSKSDELI